MSTNAGRRGGFLHPSTRRLDSIGYLFVAFFGAMSDVPREIFRAALEAKNQ